MRTVDFSLFPRNLEWGIWPGALFVTKIILGSLLFLFLKKMIRIRKSRVRTVILLLLCEILMCLLAQKILAGRRQELPGKFWNLLILLSAPVFGMLGALVIFSDQEIVNAWRDISISVLCMLYWVGMVLTVHVLGRQQELERKEYFYQMRQQY